MPTVSWKPGFQVIELGFTDTYYSTGNPEGPLQRDYMRVPLQWEEALLLRRWTDILPRTPTAPRI